MPKSRSVGALLDMSMISDDCMQDIDWYVSKYTELNRNLDLSMAGRVSPHDDEVHSHCKLVIDVTFFLQFPKHLRM